MVKTPAVKLQRLYDQGLAPAGPYCCLLKLSLVGCAYQLSGPLQPATAR